MAKRFGENEHRICSLFNEGETFEYKGNIYVVVFSDKPVCRSGEPKTDIFVRTHLYDNPNVIRDFKISYKQDKSLRFPLLQKGSAPLYQSLQHHYTVVH